MEATHKIESLRVQEKKYKYQNRGDFPSSGVIESSADHKALLRGGGGVLCHVNIMLLPPAQKLLNPFSDSKSVYSRLYSFHFSPVTSHKARLQAGQNTH